MINHAIRQKYLEKKQEKDLLINLEQSVTKALNKEDKPLGKDEDFLKTMKYIAKRLDFLILLEIQQLKLLKKKK